MNLTKGHKFIIGGVSIIALSTAGFFLIKGKSSIEKEKKDVVRGK